MTKPEIIAHRGASRERPENTLAAFSRAVELGADAIELDIHRSGDGVLYVHHDAIPHQAPTPELAERPIQTLTAEQLQRFRVEGEPIPTLAAVFERVGASLRVYCELKGARTAEPTCALLAGLVSGAFAVHSFDHRMVATARHVAPAIARGVLETSYHIDPAASLASVDGRDLWQYAKLIDQALVDTVHARGGRVIAWTVDEAAEVTRLTALGVDGLCTNDVTLAKQILGR
jgi:glycerophosphoryl diester phosphodiesterase